MGLLAQQGVWEAIGNAIIVPVGPVFLQVVASTGTAATVAHAALASPANVGWTMAMPRTAARKNFPVTSGSFGSEKSGRGPKNAAFEHAEQDLLHMALYLALKMRPSKQVLETAFKLPQPLVG